MEKKKVSRKAFIAVELSEKHQIKRAYVRAIEDYSSKSLISIFEEYISNSVKIGRGYESLKKQYNIEKAK